MTFVMRLKTKGECTPNPLLTGKFETQLPIIRKGNSGVAVSVLQSVLGVTVDGHFGDDTEASLKVFQKNTGVKDVYKRQIYNQMLADKISYYQKEKKMLRNTPAGYKREYPWLKEVDSLALANAQLHLESAFRKFFREPACGFPRYKSKKHKCGHVCGNVCHWSRTYENKSDR